MSEFTDAELTAFLDEALAPGRCAELEHQLRTDVGLRNRLIEVRGRETAGLHTLGAIWRRNRLSCPSRSDLGEFLLGTLDQAQADYIRFHIDQVGCRYCDASANDLKELSKRNELPAKRRQRYFQTSAGYLKK